MKKFKLFFTISIVFILTSKGLMAQDKKEIPTSIVKPCCETGYADVVDKLLPAVVNISALQPKKTQDFDLSFLDDMPQSQSIQDLKESLQKIPSSPEISSVGSGFIISKDGFIVTNNHVIEGMKEVLVNLEDGSKHKARLIGADTKTDLALLKIDAKKEFSFVKFGDSAKSRIGDIIIVVGNPYSLGGSVSTGIVSSNKRTINQIEGFIQTDAAINKGSSGGPMFNLKGEVIGVSSSLFSPSGGSVGIGFGAPSAIVKPIIDQLKDHGEVIRGWIGVSVQDVTEEVAQSISMPNNKGAFVIEVTKNSPAEIAGIQQTDIITKFGDLEIIDMKTLPKIVSQSPVDKVFSVTILRQGKSKILQIKIARAPEDGKKDITKIAKLPDDNKEEIDEYLLGMGLAEIEKENSGILIVDIKIDSAAKQAGLAPRDIIISANQAKINSIKDLKSIVKATKKSSKKLFLLVKRNNKNIIITMPLK